MNILYLSPWFPFPPTNGSELRINALLRGLAAEHDVTLVSFQRRPVNQKDLEEAALCRDVILVPWRAFNPGSGRALAGFLSPKPRSVVDTYSTEMARVIRQQLEANRYDLVVGSELVTMPYIAEIGDMPALLDDVELSMFAELPDDNATLAQRTRHSLMWAKQRAYIRSLLPRFAACTVVSEHERQLLSQVVPDYDAIEVIPNCIRVSDYLHTNVERNANTLIFTGAFTYRVNYEAMVWFVSEVYPLIQARIPDVQLIITGDHAGLPLPSTEGVLLTGFIDDIKEAIAGATVSIAPIRQGGGTRLKILEAMALGTPVVSTSKGAEGLDAIDGEHLLCADLAESFADATITLIQDAALRENIAKNACDLVSSEYNWEVVMPRFLSQVEAATGSRSLTHQMM